MTDVRSLRFVEASETYLIRDHSCTTGKIFTIAFWLKRTAIHNDTECMIEFGGDRSSTKIYFDSTNNIKAEGKSGLNLKSNEKILDTTDWHHITLSVDTTQTVSQDRARLYLDGTEVTYAGRGLPTQNSLVMGTSSKLYYIGASIGGSSPSDYYNGLLDEVYFVESQLLPSAFISGAPGAPINFTGAYGAKGFFINFDDASQISNLGLDYSGHGFNFTPYNIALDNSSTDIPQLIVEANDLVVGSPELGTPELSVFSLVALDLIVGSPVVDSPNLVVVGTNILTAMDLVVHNPEIGSPIFLAFNEGDLGADWTVTSSRIGTGFIDSYGNWDAAALIDTATTGPFEISQTISKPDTQQVFRLAFTVASSRSGKFIELGLSDGATSGASAIFDPATGECLRRSSTIDFHLLDIAADPIRFNYYRLVIMAETNDATSLKAFARLCDENLDFDYTGTGSGSVFISDPMLLEGADPRDFRWEIGDTDMRFYWTVHLDSLGLRWFRCGQGVCGVDTHLTIINAPDLDCVLRRWQPAQDRIVFDYSGMSIAGSGDPMAGTP